MAGSSSAVLRQLTRSAVYNSTKCFSTTPIQVSISSPFKSEQNHSLKLTAGSSIIISKRTMYSHPLAMGNPNYEEEEEVMETTNLASFLHLESISKWREEAQKLYDIMDTSDIQEEQKQPEKVSEASSKQVKSLIEELIEDDLYDPRLGWTASAKY